MTKIKIETTIKSSIEKVWKHWISPESIQGWAFASDTWECPYAENDLKVGGRFLTRMFAKDKSFSFDITGTYTEVEDNHRIVYLMDKPEGQDYQRECITVFSDLGDGNIRIVQEFDPEHENSEERQKEGWSAILQNFKNYVESN